MLGVTQIVSILMVTYFRLVMPLGIHQWLRDKLFSHDSIINYCFSGSDSCIMGAFRGLRSAIAVTSMCSKFALVLRPDLLRLVERP